MKLENFLSLFINCNLSAEIVFEQDKRSGNIRVEPDTLKPHTQKQIKIIVGTKK